MMVGGIHPYLSWLFCPWWYIKTLTSALGSGGMRGCSDCSTSCFWITSCYNDLFGFMVLNATFNNISVISLRSVLMIIEPLTNEAFLKTTIGLYVFVDAMIHKYLHTCYVYNIFMRFSYTCLHIDSHARNTVLFMLSVIYYC